MTTNEITTASQGLFTMDAKAAAYYAREGEVLRQARLVLAGSYPQSQLRMALSKILPPRHGHDEDDPVGPPEVDNVPDGEPAAPDEQAPEEPARPGKDNEENIPPRSPGDDIHDEPMR